MTFYFYAKNQWGYYILYMCLYVLKITWIFKNPMNQQIDDPKRTSQEFDQLSTPTKKHPNTQTPTNVAMLRISTSCGQQIWCKAGRFDWKTMAKHLLPKGVNCTEKI